MSGADWYVSREDTKNLIPPQPKSPLSLQHRASCRGGELLLVCLLEFTCLSAKTYIPLPLKWLWSSDAYVSTPQCREFRKLRADCRGGAQCCLFELPLLAEPDLHHLPWIPGPCDPGSSRKLPWWSLFLPDSSPSLLIPHKEVITGGVVMVTRTWGRSRDRGVGHRPSVLGGTFKDEYYVLRKVLLNICSKFQK